MTSRVSWKRAELRYLLKAEPHFIAIPALGLAYGRVPKVANSLIKRTLAHAAGLERRFPPRGFSKDNNWRGLAPDAHFIDARTLQRRFPDLFVFAFVRDPLSRLASCYRSKIAANNLTRGMAMEGLTADTTFAEFVHHVATRNDRRCNIHYRPQAAILSMPHGHRPDFIGRFENLREDWAALTKMLADRNGSALPPLPHRTKGRNVTDPSTFFGQDTALTALAADRYAEDYRLFYPGQAPT